MFSDRTNEPDLRHPHDSAEDTKAEGGDGSDARWEAGRLVVGLDLITSETLFEDKVLGESHAFVYREPIRLRVDG